MPSARATAGSLHSVAFGEPSPAYPYRGFDFILKFFMAMIFNKFFIWIIWAIPSARATTGSLHSVIASQ